MQELEAAYKYGKDFLLIDVFPYYEYQQGHLPGAVNMEFDLGDKMQLSTTKKLSFQILLGSDKSKEIVIYCRHLGRPTTLCRLRKTAGARE